MTGRLRVGVLAGGRSSEHTISLASAASVVTALDPALYEVSTIEIARDGRWALPRAADIPELPAGPAETLPVPTDGSPAALATFDVVLVLLHGPLGEGHFPPDGYEVPAVLGRIKQGRGDMGDCARLFRCGRGCTRLGRRTHQVLEAPRQPPGGHQHDSDRHHSCDHPPATHRRPSRYVRKRRTTS